MTLANMDLTALAGVLGTIFGAVYALYSKFSAAVGTKSRTDPSLRDLIIELGGEVKGVRDDVRDLSKRVATLEEHDVLECSIEDAIMRHSQDITE